MTYSAPLQNLVHCLPREFHGPRGSGRNVQIRVNLLSLEWKRSESTLLWNGTNSIIFKHRGQRPQSRRAWEAPLSVPIGRSFPEVLTEESALCKTCRTSSCCSRSSLKRRCVLRQPRLILPVSYLHSAPLKRSPPATTRQNRLPGLGFMYNALPLHNIYLVLFLVCAQRGKMRLLISE